MVFEINGKEFNIYGSGLISNEQASLAYDKLTEDAKRIDQSKKSSNGNGQWKDDETYLLQWFIFTYALQKKLDIDEFTI
jgi:hypothetical protein